MTRDLKRQWEREIQSLFSRSRLLLQQGRITEALQLAQQACEIGDRHLDRQDAKRGALLNLVSTLHMKLGRYAEAERLMQEAVQIAKVSLGERHPEYAMGLGNMAELYREMSKYKEAEGLCRGAIDILRQCVGQDDPVYACYVRNLAVLLRETGRFSEAEKLLKEVLKIQIQHPGATGGDYVSTLAILGGLYHAMGHLDAAESWFRKAMEARRAAPGAGNASDFAADLNNFALLMEEKGDFSAARRLQGQAMDVVRATSGVNSPEYTGCLFNMANLEVKVGNYAAAEQAYRGVIEKYTDRDHPWFATLLNNLAALYVAQGRYVDAEPLYRSSLKILERSFGSEHRNLAVTLSSLAAAAHPRGRHDEAEALLRRAVTILEKALGPEHPEVAACLSSLAVTCHAQGRAREAEAAAKRALVIQQNAVGVGHPSVAATLSILAKSYQHRGALPAAALLQERALTISEATYGSEHPDVADHLYMLAVLRSEQERHADALQLFRRASAIHRSRIRRVRERQVESALSAQQKARPVFLGHLAGLLVAHSEGNAVSSASTVSEAFEVAQLARASRTAIALASMSARFSEGQDELARIVREHQDAIRDWQTIERSLVESIARPPLGRSRDAEQGLRQKLAAATALLDRLTVVIERQFPAYAELALPRPLTLGDAQRLLAQDEALVVVTTGPGASFTLALSQSESQLQGAAIGTEELDAIVVKTRNQLDLRQIKSVSMLRALIPTFDFAALHDVFRHLLEPMAGILEGAKHVFLVLDGPLEKLPPGLLLTAEPPGRIENFEHLRSIPWLARRWALSILPSVSALRELRRTALRSRASKPFLGVGDPLLRASPSESVAFAETGRSHLAGGPTRSARPIGTVDINSLRNLRPLPETADELREIAREFGAQGDCVWLGTDATFPNVCSARLADYRVLAFATHALLAGELPGLTEPALVLTPTSDDDGLLTASRIARLRLDAEWVILSCCDTAAGDTPEAEVLSGLARAFFYAGTRTMLVSHWPVDSKSAVRLTTGLNARYLSNPRLGRAGALQQAMEAMFTDNSDVYFAHPAFWAPFVVVGDGGPVTTDALKRKEQHD